MKDRIRIFFTGYFLLVLLFALQKPVFMAYYHSLYPEVGFGSWLKVIEHGLKLDLSVAGYITILPGLLLALSAYIRKELIAKILRIYYLVIAIILSLIFIGDMALYEFWGFRLDATPLFYLKNPGDAMASVSVWFILLGVLAVACCTLFYYKLAALLVVQPLRKAHPSGSRRATCAALLGLTLLLFLPIRGGISVSTMNVGKVYFSDNTRLNHAAINPTFSLLESLAKQRNFSEQYRFMKPEKADSLFVRMVEPSTTTAEIPRLFKTERPNIIIVILESFMSSVTGALGGEPDATPGLDTLSREGILFTNIFANSFRTDRGLVAILSGYPAQPSTSIMKYPQKSQSLPSIPQALRQAGYSTEYYYGGDADFTNMRSYLLSQGIEHLISDKDFPLGDRLSKWGVPDHLLMARFAQDMSTQQQEPFLKIVQTSSSHEPFDVPANRFEEPYPNSVYYADSCVYGFVQAFRETPYWDNTVLVFIADHAAHYPSLGYFEEARYRIPLLIAGGAVKGPARIETYASQIDLAATLLYQLGLPHDAFTFSKNILNPDAPHFGFFSFPNGMGMATPENILIYDCDSGRTELDTGAAQGTNLEPAKAYLQKLYDDLGSR